MAKFKEAVIRRWKILVDEKNIEWRGTVTDRARAWNIAHIVGITSEAYSDPSVTDKHIETALKKIFPNAGF